MGYTSLTLNQNNWVASKLSDGTIFTVNDINDINNGLDGPTTIVNGNLTTILTHTFDSPQFLNQIVINMAAASNGCTTGILQLSTDGENFTNHTTIADLGDGNNIINITQPLVNPIKYKAFRFAFSNFDNATNFQIDYIFVKIPDNLNQYSYKDYNIEFDDSLLDMASWNNARYNGCKISGSKINVFTEGDPIYPYGLKPIIENKTCAIFIGNSIEQGEVTSSLDPLVDINNHSYVTIDTILLVDLQTLKSTKITHEQFNETENKKESFRRLVADNFPEGSKIVTKILDIATSAQLKESHHVKFNQGLLMKLYAYTANTGPNGSEDGVFGGFGIRDEKGNLIDNIVSGGGLFGFGTTVATSASLFGLSNGGPTTFTAYTTIAEFPSELSLYGNIGQITHLSPATASGTPTSDQLAYERREIE